MSLLEKYRAFREDKDEESGRILADDMYRVLSRWLESGHPGDEFLAEFENLQKKLEEGGPAAGDLIDLGLMHTADACHCFRAEGWNGHVEFHVSEARLPFFAFLDESGYRMTKNADFSEVDFQIFEIIQGDFPHDAAQNLLMEEEWVDIWLALRYLDRIEDREDRLQIIERTMRVRATLQEKLIFVSYLLLTDPEVVAQIVEPEHHGRVEFNFPPEVTAEMMTALYKVIFPFVNSGTLDTAWEERILPGYEDAAVFALLAVFEISQCPLSPGWVRVLERAASTLTEYGDTEKIQPLPEFAASILNLLPESDLIPLLETSLILPSFFDHLTGYSDDAFHDLCFALGRGESVVVRELDHIVAERYPSDGAGAELRERLHALATQLDCDIVSAEGPPRLVKRTEA